MTNIEFSQDGSEITHSVYTEFYFNESLSIGSDNIHVVVPNVPLFGLIKLMAKKYSFEKSVAKSMLQGYKGVDTKPFMNVTVKQLLWGYPSAIMTLARDFDDPPDCENDYDDPFSGKDVFDKYVAVWCNAIVDNGCCDVMRFDVIQSDSMRFDVM